MDELQFRKDIIAGFELIIETFCKGCEDSSCLFCQYRVAASAGHLNMLNEWKEKKHANKGETNI